MTASSFSTPAFEPFCEEYAARLQPTRDDPWLVGHFSDHELPLYSKTLDNFLKLPPAAPGRVAVAQWLTSRGVDPEKPELNDAMRQDFLGFVVERYLRITTAATRKADPNHLCLGPRFDYQALLSKPLFAAAGRHLDVIAVNYYHAWSPDPERMRQWIEWSGKPFLVTEWYAKGMDSGFATPPAPPRIVRGLPVNVPRRQPALPRGTYRAGPMDSVAARAARSSASIFFTST